MLAIRFSPVVLFTMGKPFQRILDPIHGRAQRKAIAVIRALVVVSTDHGDRER